MKFSTVAYLSASTAHVVSATSLTYVPGNTGAYYCHPGFYRLLEIENLDIAPSPPQSLKPLTIQLRGYLKGAISKDATLRTTVVADGITYKKEEYICQEFDIECPLRPGFIAVNRTITVPSEFPTSNYLVTVEGLSGTSDITCFKIDTSAAVSGSLKAQE